MGLIKTFEFGGERIVVTVETYEYGVSIKVGDQEIAAVDLYDLVAFDESDLKHRIRTAIYGVGREDPVAMVYANKEKVEIVSGPFETEYEFKEDEYGYRWHTLTTMENQ